VNGRRRVLCLALAAVFVLGVERPGGLGDVVEVRHWSYPDYTRVVVEFTAPVTSEVQHLNADTKAGRPERLYLDIDGIWVGRRFEKEIEVGDGLLAAVRLGQNTLKKTRVVIDVDHYERHRLIHLSNPERLVVDVYGPRKGRPSPGHADRGAAPEGRSLPAWMRPVRTVVLDAGHGGRDPGAIGIGGLREKDVTLRLARELGERLGKRGFRVVYTRTKDREIGLEERTAIAEGAGGDVFISIHANAAPRRSVHGIETYYLNENHERHSIDLAARENGIARSQVNALQRTLAKLSMQEVSPQSRLLAKHVHHEILRGMSTRYGEVADLGVKKGPFYVLFLSDMPAILLEAGFLTNRQDAQRLRDPKYLAVLADEIADGLVRYRDNAQTVAFGAAR
jgi:N-acetylmuramoyl-L-alanine amidase